MSAQGMEDSAIKGVRLAYETAKIRAVLGKDTQDAGIRPVPSPATGRDRVAAAGERNGPGMDPIRTYRADELTRAIANNRGLLLLHFGSPLASPCELIHRQLETLAPLFEGRLDFGEVELPLQDLELIGTFRIEDVPTLLIFQGQKEIERLDAVLTIEALKNTLESVVSFYSDSSSQGVSPHETDGVTGDAG